MKIEILKSRIKRNNFVELAGVSFRANNSQLVQGLKKDNKAALVGIQREDGVYTVLGKNFTYYRSKYGVEGQISHGELMEVFKKNALGIGKFGDFEFVEIKEECFVWVLNGNTMNAIWNTIMLLHK